MKNLRTAFGISAFFLLIFCGAGGISAQELKTWISHRSAGSGKVEMSITNEARNGKGALKATFLPWKEGDQRCGIVKMEPGIDGGWPAYGEYQGIRFWFKGDGSTGEIIFHISANSWKENYVLPLSLSNKDWRLVEIPWNTLKCGPGIVFNPLTMQRFEFSINPYLGGTIPCPGFTFWLDDIELYTGKENPRTHKIDDFE